MQDWHVKCNNVADVLANDAAAFHDIPINQAQPIIDVLKNPTLIQNRLLQFLTLYPQRPCTAPILPKIVYSHTKTL